MLLSDSVVLPAQVRDPLTASLMLLLHHLTRRQHLMLPCLGVDEMLVALWFVSGT